MSPRPVVLNQLAQDMRHGAMCASRMGGVCDCRVAEDVVSKDPTIDTSDSRERLIESITRALYAPNHDHLSVRACAEDIVKALENHTNLVIKWTHAA